MKQYCRYLPIFTILFALFILLPNFLSAQAPDPGAGDIDAPIDGGITLLLAAGVGYGVKKHRENRKKKAAPIV